MTKEIMDLFVVEYSVSQKAFNLCTVREMLDHNCRMILSHKTSNDYLVVGIAESYDEANRLRATFEGYIDREGTPLEITYDELLS